MSNENKGLASADEETRERVARKGGEASPQNGNIVVSLW
jgi:general stress protein YciG